MYEIDPGSGQNHADTVSRIFSRALLKFQNILKWPVLLKSHDTIFWYTAQINCSKQMIHKGFEASESSVSEAITSSHNQVKPKYIREFEVCDFHT